MSETPYIDKFTTNLSQQVARQPKRYQALERDNEINQLRLILNQERKNSAALIGEAGVGKTAIVEGLAVQLLAGETHDKVSDKEIITLTLPNLMEFSNGHNFATNLQGLIDELLVNRDRYLLFIDEMHQLIGTGSSNNSMMDAANILKPIIGRGEINIIGATTLAEYHESIESDNAMDRRFDKVLIEETSMAQTMRILTSLAHGYEKTKRVQSDQPILAYVYQLSDRFMTTQFFPEKSIMLLDSATTIAHLAGDTVLKKEHVAKKIHDQFHVPMDVLLADDSARILNLPKVLRSRVIGQQDALKKIERRIRSRSAGLGDNSKPLSFLLAGPTGVGKTETAKALANALFGSDDDMIRFDMSEFKDAQRSVGLFQERLTESVKYHPYSVLLLDEVEKADPLVLDLLLQVLDDGRLTNRFGRTINFKDLLIILTTNLGHDQIENYYANSVAYRSDRRNQETFMTNFESVLRGAGMRREFVKRISATIIYEPLQKADVLKIIDLKLAALARKAQAKGWQLIYRLADVAQIIPTFKAGYEIVQKQKIASHPIEEFIFEKGYKTTDGARTLDDAINEYIENVLAEAILEEQFTGQSAGHTFIFRAQGQAPDQLHAFGTWRSIYNQIDPKPVKEVQTS